MPRTARAVEAGSIYHVLNRGNGRMTLFRKPQDFLAFQNVLIQALERYQVDLLSYCLMSNHWHLVLRPRADAALGRFMGWLGVTHVRRHHAHYHTSGGGHLYQGRYKSFPVQDDQHLLTLCRYVEANALRAGLVKRAQDWPWCALAARMTPINGLTLLDWPLERPRNWLQLVNQSMHPDDAMRIRTSIVRERPYGSDRWVTKTARRLGLDFTLHARGRPRVKSVGEKKE